MLRLNTRFGRLHTLVWLMPLLALGGCSDSEDGVDAIDGASMDGGIDPASDGTLGDGQAASGDTGPDLNVDAGAEAQTAPPDVTPPSVLSTQPLDAATGASSTSAITATFNEDMNPASLASFGLKQGDVVVAGTVSYFNRTVTFVPTSALALATVYTATITTAATDLAGNALSAVHAWSFTTDAKASVGPMPVLLGAAGNYVILAKSEISNVPSSLINGNLGLSPAAASYITGFALTRAGTMWTSAQVVGGIFAANNDPPTPQDLTTAVSHMEAAYTDAAGRPTPDFLNLQAGSLGGLTLAPGLYKWTSSVTIPSDVSLAGAANDVWIFQVTGNLTMSAAKAMTLTGGARAKNVFWQVAGNVEFGTTSHAEGVVLSKTAIKLGTGASIVGRLLAQTAVNIASSTVTAPAP